MRGLKIFRGVLPFVSAAIVIATAAALVFTIYFTELGPQWITFLAGILAAAILAQVTGRSRAEFVVLRRTVQLSSIKAKLERESQLRKKAELEILNGKSRLRLIDEVLPTMVAFIDKEGSCQYHNRAFLNWLHLRPEQVNGMHIRKVLGAKIYQETATAIRQSLDGHAVHFERMQNMPDGAIYRLSVEHLPQYGEDGKVSGFYMLINDITEPGDVHTQSQPDMSAHQDMFVDTYAEQVTGQKDADRIRMAIENGEFSLFCQLITSLSGDSGIVEHYEILIRLKGEEKQLAPPGSFFPLAEKYGLMTHLDRWVVQHVAEWISRQNINGGGRKDALFFINVAGATIADTSFPEFLQLTLLEHGVPGTALCFEIPESELALKNPEVAEFARQVMQCGCHVALSGFGRDRVLFDLIRGFQVEFLKIDGSVILDILHDPVKLAKVNAINQVAKKIGVKTIAEMVESEEIIAKLKEIKVDFAQGFGISHPRPLGR